jgi:capsid protein
MPVDPALAGLGPISNGATPGAPPILHMKPGTLQELPEGKDVKFASPQSSGGLEVFARETLRAIATGVGVPYELMTGDLSDVNYTSFRAGTLQFRDQVEMHQWLVLIPQFCLPVVMLWTFLGYLKGKWDVMAPEGMDWGLPEMASVDPVKDATSQEMLLKAGVKDLQRIYADRGEDWRKGLDSIAEVDAYAKSIGLEGFAPAGFGAPKVAAAREDSAAVNSDASSETGDEQTPRQSRQTKKRQAK